ncbi:hypothetical protein KSS87_013381 [Heliosperma pusillum]|nr:hypothetical protein KSS87_013381 [Heliosperma pusillum]
MHILWKSSSWRWIVTKTRDSKPFFFTFAMVCGVIPGIVGYGVMQVTSSSNEKLEAHLRRNSRPDTRIYDLLYIYFMYFVIQMMGQVNKERLAEYLTELKEKKDTNDRYVAALKGETLTRKPYVRIQPIPNQNSSESTK